MNPEEFGPLARLSSKCKLQTHPLVRKGTSLTNLQLLIDNFRGWERRKRKIGHGSQMVA
jgi:hypothetical protein